MFKISRVDCSMKEDIFVKLIFALWDQKNYPAGSTGNVLKWNSVGNFITQVMQCCSMFFSNFCSLNKVPVFHDTSCLQQSDCLFTSYINY